MAFPLFGMSAIRRFHYMIKLWHFLNYWTDISYRPFDLQKKSSRGALVFLEISQNSQENTYAKVYFLIKLKAEACNFIKKETLTQVFSCGFCKISKQTFFCRAPPVAAFKLDTSSSVKQFCLTMMAFFSIRRIMFINTQLLSTSQTNMSFR